MFREIADSKVTEEKREKGKEISKFPICEYSGAPFDHL